MILAKLLNRLGYVPKSEYDEVAEQLEWYRTNCKGDITIRPSHTMEVTINGDGDNIRFMLPGDVANMDIEPGYTKIEIRR